MSSSISPQKRSVEHEMESSISKGKKDMSVSIADNRRGHSMSPSRSQTQPRRTATATPNVHSPNLLGKTAPNSFFQSPSPSSSASAMSSPSGLSAPSASTSATSVSGATSQHPLAQPPITAPTASATSSPAPLPFVSLLPPQVNSLRAGLVRRRSSYPPATTPGSGSASNIFPWVMGGTPGANGFDWGSAFDAFPGFGSELGPGQEVGNLAWDTLLSFETEGKVPPTKMASSNLASAKPILITTEAEQKPTPVSRAKSDTPSDGNLSHTTTQRHTPQSDAAATPTTLQPAHCTPVRVVQFGADLAWRTALASVVEVEGVGSVTVARVLQEVWRRGGGELVTNQCLWPSIVIALAMPTEPGPGVRVPNPSAQSSMGLQQLYNLSIKHWEPAIFTGLLGAYAASLDTPPPNTVEATAAAAVNAFAPIPHYGPSTPLREPDVSQWMNLTPSGWSFLPNDVTLLNGNTDEKPHQPDSFSMPGFPFPVHADLMEGTGSQRRASLSKIDGGDDMNIKGIDEILASMEEGNEETERAVIAANIASEAHLNLETTPQSHETPVNPTSSQNSSFQFPTPETESSHSPSRRDSKTGAILSPISMSSPYVTANSSSISAPTPTPVATQAVNVAHRPAPAKVRPSQLSMPAMPPVEFIPPPPMCMFFNPSFENLTDGKAGIWRGDLEVRGKGGGKFPIIVVGEKDTEHLWQSHLWPQTMTYPLTTNPVESCTSTMIPVSHLAREGLIPITMGMVLCNETPERLAPYVNMVHGLHAEGVGFHLPCETRLPIVFLPAKFHSSDPLLRLGIAFMGKAGYPHPNAPMPSNAGQMTNSRGRIRASGDAGTEEIPKKKRRRLSAPASATAGSAKSRKKGSPVATSAKIEEEAE